jgi:hypothetical protein
VREHRCTAHPIVGICGTVAFMPMPSFTRAEMWFTAEMLHVLLCYLDAADQIGAALQPPTPSVGALAASAADAASWASTPTRSRELWLGSGLILGQARRWLTDDAAAVRFDTSELLDAGELFDTAALYVRAMCPTDDQRAALALLDPQPLYADRVRQRRRHPIRALRGPQWPRVFGLETWRPSLWGRRADHSGDTAALLHASAGIATAVWRGLDHRRDPIRSRDELRTGVSRLREEAASGGLLAA